MTASWRGDVATLLAMVVAHEAIAQVLDRASGAPLAVTVLLTLALLVVRLALCFLAPGWALARTIEAVRGHRSIPERNRTHSERSRT